MSRAISVIIWMYNPNKLYSFYIEGAYKDLELETDLLDALGWNQELSPLLLLK